MLLIASCGKEHRPKTRQTTESIVDAFLRNWGPSAEKVLSGYMGKAATGLIQLVTEEHRRVAPKPAYDRVVELITFDKIRIGRADSMSDRYGDFKGKKGIGFQGYTKSLYSQD